ncbi:hypothetical protein VP150E351_P0162 [Vibrio phage 150E35-1]|nr:hypothetical protein VP150E351_P0162 [Vibrio phage 150E35-1]
MSTHRGSRTGYLSTYQHACRSIGHPPVVHKIRYLRFAY